MFILTVFLAANYVSPYVYAIFLCYTIIIFFFLDVAVAMCLFSVLISSIFSFTPMLSN
jgi:hypothetical protein